ncbi:peptide-methionine (S)-S-oxide reductase [Vibrio parahaemolyticus]|nr:peptide-methionine (S)-S-oxide reductase [Vibrio parahaemolyticus]
MEEIYFAGGCLWGVQEFMRHLPGVISTEAGRANGKTDNTQSEYDGYAECVRTEFDPSQVSVETLMGYFFEIAKSFIATRDDADKIAVEVLPLKNYVPSDEEHQDRLTRFPNDYCHIPLDLLHKYKNK